LAAWTPSDKVAIVATALSVLSIADPAPLMSALLTRDVVAASVLISGNLALRARFDIVLAHISTEVSIPNVCTSYPAVIDSSTSHADFLAARTDCPLSESVDSAHEVHAPISRTPAQIRVKVHVYVHLKTNILFENFF
jgi:hypothetical protein